MPTQRARGVRDEGLDQPTALAETIRHCRWDAHSQSLWRTQAAANVLVDLSADTTERVFADSLRAWLRTMMRETLRTMMRDIHKWFMHLLSLQSFQQSCVRDKCRDTCSVIYNDILLMLYNCNDLAVVFIIFVLGLQAYLLLPEIWACIPLKENHYILVHQPSTLYFSLPTKTYPYIANFAAAGVLGGPTSASTVFFAMFSNPHTHARKTGVTSRCHQRHISIPFFYFFCRVFQDILNTRDVVKRAHCIWDPAICCRLFLWGQDQLKCWVAAPVVLLLRWRMDASIQMCIKRGVPRLLARC